MRLTNIKLHENKKRNVRSTVGSIDSRASEKNVGYARRNCSGSVKGVRRMSDAGVRVRFPQARLAGTYARFSKAPEMHSSGTASTSPSYTSVGKWVRQLLLPITQKCIIKQSLPETYGVADIKAFRQQIRVTLHCILFFGFHFNGNFSPKKYFHLFCQSHMILDHTILRDDALGFKLPYVDSSAPSALWRLPAAIWISERSLTLCGSPSNTKSGYNNGTQG